MFGETLRVIVALIELPGLSVAPSRFQLTVMNVWAFGGFQFRVVMFSDNGTLP